MDRRKSLKLIATGVIATPVAIAACKSKDKKEENKSGENNFTLDRNPDELKYENELLGKENFFTPHEMETISLLADIIIPRDDVSGNATDAKVPEFIEFIVKDMPNHQVPMRGGLKWLDMQCHKRFNKVFTECKKEEQIQMVDLIAFPDRVKDKPDLQPGVAFFSLMRNLTATGFYTSEIGIKDIGYIGNTANQWKGVPADVLAKHKISYSEKELKESI